MADPALPTGTVTFLFTDIEGSTRMLQALGDAYGPVLEQHRRLIREPVRANGGIDFGSEGDALFVVFRSASGALAAAVAAQQALASAAWPPDGAVRVRMGIHTGEATLVGEGYVGLDLHRVARIAAAGHGGQVLVSQATLALVRDALPAGVDLRDLGERRLKDLSRPEHLFQLVIPGLPSDFPALRTLDATINNLPTQVTSFVGREREVAEAKRILETSRLLTLTGPGGTGKTRLSLQIAADIASTFPDGAFFVPLDAVSDPALVPSAIVTSLAVQDAGRAPAERLLEHLRTRRALLVLDNFEQVLSAASVVSDILRASPGTKVIVSSRAALHVSGEQEFPVPPLGLPDQLTPPIDLERLTHFESVALFIERAASVRPDFRVTNENAPAVAEICARLDGLPLAIELAAARVKMLPPEAILSRLGSRLGLLGGGARDLPERQQTLRGAIAWSYDLLDESSRRLLARLSIFVGGCRLDHAEAVCGTDDLGIDVFDGLAGLVDQSLVRQVESSGEPRFAMLQTIRDFALEQLATTGDAATMARRHAEVFLALAEEAEPFLLGPQQRRWLDTLEREHDNLRGAISWAIEAGEAELAVRLGSVLWRFWQIRGYLREAARRLEQVVAMPGVAGPTALRRRALDALAGTFYWMADLRRAQELYEQSLAIAEEIGDQRGIAEAEYNLSFVFAVDKSDPVRAQQLDEQALARYRALGDRHWTARSLWALGNAIYFQDDLARARPPIEEAIEILRALDDPFGLGWGLHLLGMIDLRLGDIDGARRNWTEMLGIFHAAEDVTGVGTGLNNFRTLAVEDGDGVRSARLGGAAAGVVQRTGSDLTDIIPFTEGRIEREAAMIDRPTAEAAWAEGQAMTMEEAVAYALERGAAVAKPVGAVR
jgi:predicted ATPase/class 3 adenylate cyclase